MQLERRILAFYDGTNNQPDVAFEAAKPVTNSAIEIVAVERERCFTNTLTTFEGN